MVVLNHPFLLPLDLPQADLHLHEGFPHAMLEPPSGRAFRMPPCCGYLNSLHHKVPAPAEGDTVTVAVDIHDMGRLL